MNPEDRVDFIVKWIKDYCNSVNNQPVTLVVGISGGIDSAVTSVLCARTSLKTIAVSIPIKQNITQYNLSLRHLKWLENNFKNVETKVINLDETFNNFSSIMKDYNNELAFANSRSRIRMVTLYQIAQSKKGLVVGTGLGIYLGDDVDDFPLRKSTSACTSLSLNNSVIPTVIMPGMARFTSGATKASGFLIDSNMYSSADMPGLRLAASTPK